MEAIILGHTGFRVQGLEFGVRRSLDLVALENSTIQHFNFEGSPFSCWELQVNFLGGEFNFRAQPANPKP